MAEAATAIQLMLLQSKEWQCLVVFFVHKLLTFSTLRSILIFFDFPTLGYNAFQLFVFSCEFLIFKNIHYFIVFINYIIDDNLAILI